MLSRLSGGCFPAGVHRRGRSRSRAVANRVPPSSRAARARGSYAGISHAGISVAAGQWGARPADLGGLSKPRAECQRQYQACVVVVRVRAAELELAGGGRSGHVLPARELREYCDGSILDQRYALSDGHAALSFSSRLGSVVLQMKTLVSGNALPLTPRAPRCS